jgi:hypothetical protein
VPNPLTDHRTGSIGANRAIHCWLIDDVVALDPRSGDENPVELWNSELRRLHAKVPLSGVGRPESRRFPYEAQLRVPKTL